MSTKTMRKAARDLVLGDVVAYPDDVRLVVFAIDQSDPNSGAPPFTSIHWAPPGDYRPTKPLFCSPDSQFTVELPAGLTPVQQAADKLLGYARLLSSHARHFNVLDEEEETALRALLEELEPPKPPTLDEALAALRELVSPRNVLHSKYEKACESAHALLKRVPN